MQAKIEQNSGRDLSEEYEDPIFNKSLSEIADPVISPYSGHIYDRADIVQWINRSGTDPMTRQPLTVAMLTSGRFVKQIFVRAENTETHLMRMFGEMASKMEKDKKDTDARIETQNQKIDRLTRSNTELTEQLSGLQSTVEGLTKENKQLREKSEQLLKENEQLKKGYIHPVYQRHGLDVENKLKAGSDPFRTQVLGNYATKIKQAVDEDALLIAANDTAPLESAAVSAPRGYGLYSMFGWKSETTYLATQLKDKINLELGSTL